MHMLINVKNGVLMLTSSEIFPFIFLAFRCDKLPDCVIMSVLMS